MIGTQLLRMLLHHHLYQNLRACLNFVVWRFGDFGHMFPKHGLFAQSYGESGPGRLRPKTCQNCIFVVVVKSSSFSHIKGPKRCFVLRHVCPAANFKKTAPGWEKCVEFVCGTLPGDSEKWRKIARDSHCGVSPSICIKLVHKLCSHNFHNILGRDEFDVPKMLLHNIFLESWRQSKLYGQ